MLAECTFGMSRDLRPNQLSKTATQTTSAPTRRALTILTVATCSSGATRPAQRTVLKFSGAWDGLSLDTSESPETLENPQKLGCCSAHQQSRTRLTLTRSMRTYRTVPDRAPPSVPSVTMRGPRPTVRTAPADPADCYPGTDVASLDPRHRSEVASARMHTRRGRFVPEAEKRLRHPLAPGCESPAPTFTRPSLPPPHRPSGDALRLPSDGCSLSVHKNTPADLETCTKSKPSSRPPFLPLQQLPRRLGVAGYGEAHVGNGSCDLESARRPS